jgi:uncharacterized protein
LLAFDCLEFDPALRWMDVAEDLATLHADLHTRGQPVLGAAFLNDYLAQSGDYPACRLLNLYQAHRSLVRAKVMALNARDAAQHQADTTEARRRYRRYLECAQAFLSPRPPRLILMHGLSGSGKSWLAQRLAPAQGAVCLSSDRERTRVSGAEGYSAEARARVYRHLEYCAQATLTGGMDTLVDATFASRAQRAQFQALAARFGVALCLVHCQAPRELLRARIVERLQRHSDASQADLDVLAGQEREAEPLAAEEQLRVFTVNTADPASLAGLDQALAQWRGA